MHPRSVVFAVKPFMQRRVWAALAAEMAGGGRHTFFPPLTLDDYFTAELPAEKVIHIMWATCSGCGSTAAGAGRAAAGSTGSEGGLRPARRARVHAAPDRGGVAALNC